MTKPQAERLRQGREQAGYTQKEAAAALAVAYSTYRGWESGLSEPGNLETAAQICNLFSISMDWWLRDHTDQPDPEQQELLRLTNQLTPETRSALIEFLQRVV